MKKLIILLLFTIPLIGQVKKDINGGYYWSDSLFNDIYVDTSATPDDTTAAVTESVLDIKFNYEWMTITCVDTGATYDDSVKVEIGTKTYVKASGGTSQGYVVDDTLWNIAAFVRDSTWTNLNILVDDNNQKSYTVFVGDAELIRVSLINAVLVENLVFKFYAVLTRKR